jgi:hypothetical protein
MSVLGAILFINKKKIYPDFTIKAPLFCISIKDLRGSTPSKSLRTSESKTDHTGLYYYVNLQMRERERKREESPKKSHSESLALSCSLEIFLAIKTRACSRLISVFQWRSS